MAQAGLRGSVEQRLVEQGGGGGKPQSDMSLHLALRSPPCGVQLSLRTLEVSVVSPPESCFPAVVLLVLPLCCPPGCSPPTPQLSSPASSRCFLGFGSGCAHNIFSPVPAAFCARVPRGGGCGGGRVKETSGREEEQVAEGSPEVSSCFWEYPWLWDRCVRGGKMAECAFRWFLESCKHSGFLCCGNGQVSSQFPGYSWNNLEFSVLPPLERGMEGFPNPSVAPFCP